MKFFKLVLKLTEIYLIVAIIGVILALYYFTWHDHYTLVEVKEINISPYTYYETDKINTSILPYEKLHRKYKYVFISNSSRLHVQSYLTLHPQDAVEKSYKGEGEYSVLVFSNNLPDAKFFKVKK